MKLPTGAKLTSQKYSGIFYDNFDNAIVKTKTIENKKKEAADQKCSGKEKTSQIGK